MKRSLLLTLLCIALSSLKSQNLQLRNGNFDNWTKYSYGIFPKVDYYSPTYWGQAKHGTGIMASLAGVVVTKSTDVPANQNVNQSALLTSGETLGIIQNGALTSGITNVGSDKAADATKNYTYTDTSKNPMPLDAKPDYIQFWGKYIPMNDTPTKGSNLARVRATIHNKNKYQDPEINNDYSGIVGTAILNFPSTDNSWEQFQVPFDYSMDDGTISPQYILINFTTNAEPGEGSKGDQLFIAKVELIYNALLKSISLDGTPIPDFDMDITSYTIEIEQGTDPIATYELQSRSATVTTSNNRTGEVSTWFDTFSVVSADGFKTKTYTINYTETTPSEIRASTTPSATLAPNPAQNFVEIANLNVAQAEIFNLQGQSVLTVSNVAANRIDVSILPIGSYILQLNGTEGETLRTKLLINR